MILSYVLVRRKILMETSNFTNLINSEESLQICSDGASVFFVLFFPLDLFLLPDRNAVSLLNLDQNSLS